MTSARRRLAPEQRRAQLLDIGARLFADRPYEDVWIEEVAELAEVSRGLMYHYVPTKRDFFAAIVERESCPVKAMTRQERLEHVWSATHDEYRGYAGERFEAQHPSKRTILVYGLGATELKLLDDLSDDEIAAKLPVHLRHLPSALAA